MKIAGATAILKPKEKLLSKPGHLQRMEMDRSLQELISRGASYEDTSFNSLVGPSKHLTSIS